MGQYDRYNQLQLDIAIDLLRLLVAESQFAAIDELTQYVREMLSDEVIHQARWQQRVSKTITPLTAEQRALIAEAAPPRRHRAIVRPTGGARK